MTLHSGVSVGSNSKATNMTNYPTEVDAPSRTGSINTYDQAALENLLAMPSSTCELILVTGGSAIIQYIGSIRSHKITEGNLYILSPRNRGILMQDIEGNITANMASVSVLDLHGIINIQVSKVLDVKSNPSNDFLKAALSQRDESLLDRAIKAVKYPPIHNVDLILEAVEIIEESKGDVRVSEVYEKLGISKSTLENLFLKTYGMTPKEYSRIIRLRHFIRSHRNSDSLTATTYQCGYYDQSHVIKEFRYFMDSTPSEFFKAQA